MQEGLKADTYAIRGRITSRMTIKKKTDIQLRLSYRGPRETTQGRSKSITSLDISANRDILKKKATLTLSIRDVFNSRKYRSTTFIDDTFFSDSEFQWRARTATLTFNYRLNQKKKRGGRRGGGSFGGGGEGDF